MGLLFKISLEKLRKLVQLTKTRKTKEKGKRYSEEKENDEYGLFCVCFKESKKEIKSMRYNTEHK